VLSRALTSWQSKNWQVTVPAGTLSATLTFESTSQYVDQIYVNADAPQF
jgi:hypothetical protein